MRAKSSRATRNTVRGGRTSASKFSLLSPLDRIRRDLAERGVPLAMATLVSFVERGADLLAPIDDLHWRELLSSSWMATDGTGLKVLVPGLSAAHDGYVELYRNASARSSSTERTRAVKTW